jgi:hypothetical protein
MAMKRSQGKHYILFSLAVACVALWLHCFPAQYIATTSSLSSPIECRLFDLEQNLVSLRRHVEGELNSSQGYERLDGGGHEYDRMEKWIGNLLDKRKPWNDGISRRKPLRDHLIEWFGKAKDRDATQTFANLVSEFGGSENLKVNANGTVKVVLPRELFTSYAFNSMEGVARRAARADKSWPFHGYRAGGKTVYVQGYDYFAAARECMAEFVEQCEKIAPWIDPSKEPPAAVGKLRLVFYDDAQGGILYCQTGDGLRHALALSVSKGEPKKVRISSIYPTWVQ